MLNEENRNAIRIYSALEGIPEDEFENALMAEAIENYKTVRSGGMVETIPNPQFNIVIPENGKEFIAILSRAAKELYNLNANIEYPLLSTIEFFNNRLFEDSDELRERFKNNLRIEGTQAEIMNK